MLGLTHPYPGRSASVQLPAEAPAARAHDPHVIASAAVIEGGACHSEEGYALSALVDERKGAPLMGRITDIRKQLAKELGFVVPLVKVTDDLSLPGNCYRISVAGVIVGEDEVYPNEIGRAHV